MKFSKATSIGLVLLASTTWLFAREVDLYKFSAGQTNVFAVEISVRSEIGLEIYSGNIFIATVEANTNAATLNCRGDFRVKTRRTSAPGPGIFPGMMTPTFEGPMGLMPNNFEVSFDSHGNELRDGGDYVLPIPLGKLMQSLYPPLPEKSRDSETLDSAAVLDDPLWLGPADTLRVGRQNGMPWAMNYLYRGGWNAPGRALLVERQTKTQFQNSGSGQAELHRQCRLESPLQSAGGPRLLATSTTIATYDETLGLFSRIETGADVNSQTETTSRHAKVTFKSHLLTGDELSKIMTPPPPPRPQKISGAELADLMAKLRSTDLETRQSGIRSLNGRDVDLPTPELMERVGAMALDTDSFVRMAAANFISNHATTNEVPVLLKLLKASDWSVRQPAIKALGQLRDERAAQPLADLLARQGNTSSEDVTAALENLGTPAEKAVINLLNEHNNETRRLACTVLQQIGTNASIDDLQKLVMDNDQSVSQVAADAIRAIKERQ